MVDSVTGVAPSTQNYSHESVTVLYSTSGATENITKDEDTTILETIQLIQRSILVVEGSLSLVLNLIIIISVTKYVNPPRPSILLILNLSVSDTVVSLGLVVASVYYLKWTIIPLCAAKEILDFIGRFGNLFSVFLIALDRFISVTWPMHHASLMNTKKIKVSLTIVWVFCIIIPLVTLAYEIDLPPEKAEKFCAFPFYLPSWYFYSILALGTCLSVSAFGLYIKVIFVICKRKRFMATSSNLAGNQNTGEKVTKLMTSLVFVHFVLYLPAIFYMLIDSDLDPMTYDIVALIVICLLHASPIVNILIYIKGTRTFENAIYNSVHCMRIDILQSKKTFHRATCFRIVFSGIPIVVSGATVGEDQGGCQPPQTISLLWEGEHGSSRERTKGELQ